MEIFAYWSKQDTSAIALTIKVWSEQFPEFHVISDAEVIPILQGIEPSFVELYERIAIPSCRSDLARLAFLYEYGGLYVDCAGHPTDPEMIRTLLHELDTYDLILLNNKKAKSYFQPINGVIFGKKGSTIIRKLLVTAMGNISNVKDGAPYNIWWLTGAGLFLSLLRDPDKLWTLNPIYRSRIRTIDYAGRPIRLNVHKGYLRLGPHWSIRQAVEPLFSSGPSLVGHAGEASVLRK